MNLKFSIFVALFAFCGLAAAHKYKSGECPQVEPMSGFDMKKVSHAFRHRIPGNDRLDIIQLTGIFSCTKKRVMISRCLLFEIE